VQRAHKPTAAFYRYLYTGVGEPWMWWQRSVLGDRELLALIDPEKVEVYVLYVAGTPAGYFELDLKQFPSIELAYFGLMPQFTGIKLGPYMMGLALETAWAHGPDRLWIHTCDMDHPAALTLYQRSGFEIFAEETETFDDPRLTSGNK
ncbi:MAG TPA: GNAT family N-acetyltransferase, partial [Rhodospirillales bacterium]|nr:GNAT family N-acetyltransferase [Rhodospirillales bacterium]